MKARWFTSAALVALIAVSAPRADDKDDKEKKAELYARLVQGPAGVSKVEMDKEKNGRIRSVLIVGKARISTVLGKEKGLQDAQEKAVISAKSKYMQWLKEEVSVRQGAEMETVVITEGAEDEKGGGVREYGKAVDKSTTKFESVAKGLVTGLQTVYYEQDGENKTYSVIMKWTDRTPDAAPKERPKLEPKKVDKTIPSKKGVIDE